MKSVASIVIPTYNRVEELRQLLQSALAQSVVVEIHVMDDGGNSEARDMIQKEFPTVNYHHIDAKRGPAFQRNRGIELASHNIVFPVDDDSLFVSPYTIEQTLMEFNDPRIGAIAIPYINIRKDNIVRQRSPQPNGIYVDHAYVGASHAVRRDVFLKVGGYREHFFYMVEEGDYCLRMLDAGYVTRLGNADAIHHLESPHRDISLACRLGRCNDILFAWHNVPMPHLLVHLIGSSINGLLFGIRTRQIKNILSGMIMGYKGCLANWGQRKPVNREAYCMNRKLKKYGPLQLADIEELYGL